MFRSALPLAFSPTNELAASAVCIAGRRNSKATHLTPQLAAVWVKQIR
jgi:hypothetical protein